jgi:hypothetical protein
MVARTERQSLDYRFPNAPARAQQKEAVDFFAVSLPPFPIGANPNG